MATMILNFSASQATDRRKKILLLTALTFMALC